MDCSDVPLSYSEGFSYYLSFIQETFSTFFFSFVSLQSEQTYCFKVGNDVFRGSQSLPQT